MILYSGKTFFKTDKARKGGLEEKTYTLKRKNVRIPLMKRCVSVKMTILKGGSREERDSSPDIFIQVKSGFSGLEGSRKNWSLQKGRSSLGSVCVGFTY